MDDYTTILIYKISEQSVAVVTNADARPIDM